jgi:hypothetical protein
MTRTHGFCLLFLAACDGGTVTIQPIAPQTGRVSEELTVNVAFDNPDGRAVDLRIDPASTATITGFERVTDVSATPSGGTFRWVPLAAHQGSHVITLNVTSPDGGTIYDSEMVNITIEAASDAAPVFVRPGAGGTYDLTTSPCVTFDVEVRDDDTTVVDIGIRGELPEQASLANAGDKRAIFDWCPTPDQIAAAERYTIPLYADDGEHPATEHDYTIVLRSGPGRDDCPGDSPSISISTPRMDERVTSGSGFPVEISVSDDMGLRDAPLLYYSLTEPEDPSMPDVTQFDQLTFDEVGGGIFSARIPSFGLAEGDEATVYFLVSASDNDDPTGSLCDHRTDSALTSFIAVGGEAGGGTLAECDPCGASADCASGLCAASASGGRCVGACSEEDCAAGTCGATVTTEGATRAGCGPVSEICGGGSTMCTDDGREPDDTIGDATPLTGAITDGQVCPMDDDYFSVSVPTGNRVTVTVDDFVHAEGDIDLQLRNMSGMILGSSASVRDSESVSYCNGGAATTLYARVFGFGSEQNSYSISATNMPDASGCCIDDAFENDDSRTTARTVTFASDLASPEGTLCTSDDDWIAIPMSGPGRIQATVIFDAVAGDIDIELYGPTGTRIASSAGTTDTEEIDTTVGAAGTYALRIFLYRGNNADGWAGEIRRSFGTTCTDTSMCPSGTVCNAGSCVADSCTSMAMCPANHLCPTTGPSSPRWCADTCAVNTDCRTGEACKWYPEGRACGRTGSGLNGAPCLNATFCGGQRTCVAWPGGFCARARCTTNADCEGGTYCVSEGGINVCAVDCPTLDDDPCRYEEGYDCEYRPTLGGTNQWVCVPL